MSFEQISYLAQIVASVGIIVSLIFVGLQIRQNTGVLQRNEHNSTMAQWTVIRMAIARNRDIAELMTAGLHGERVIDAADQLRLEQMLAEQAWAAFHIWDRTQRGIFPKGTFEATGGGAPVRLAQNGGRRNLVAHCQTDRVASRVRLGRQAVLTKNGEEAVGVNSMESPKT